MIRATCPHCQASFNAPPNSAGRKAKCPKCGGGFVVAPGQYAEGMTPTVEFAPAKTAPTPALFEFDESPATPPRKTPGKPAGFLSTRRGLLIAGGMMLGLLLICFVGVVALPQRNNAECPYCDHKFTIPEKYRGTNAEFTREFRCPHCGLSFPATVLYIENEDDKPSR